MELSDANIAADDNSDLAREEIIGKSDKKRIISLDLLRILCCISIILLHESTFILNHYQYWSLINTIVRPALWVFFMLSGYFLLEKPIDSITRFYIRRISKIVIGLVVYSILYQTCWNIGSIKSIGQFFDLISVEQILSGRVPWAEHFWFIYAIIALYILTPFIGQLFRSLSDKQFIYFISIVFVFMVIPPLLLNYLKISLNINIFIANEAFFYYILGYAVLRLKLYLYKKPIYILGVACLILTFFSNFNDQLAANLYTSSINMTILAIFEFVLFNNMELINKSGKAISNIISYVSASTFSIYLVHVFIMGHICLFDIFNFSDSNYGYQVIVNTLVIFAISFIASQIIDLVITKPLNAGVKTLVAIYDREKAKRDRVHAASE